MLNFRYWLESQDWNSFRRERGYSTEYSPVGNYPSPTFMKSITDDPDTLDAVSKGEDSHKISDLKMLHDRILDSAVIKPEDVEEFFVYVLSYIPYDHSQPVEDAKKALSDIVKELRKSYMWAILYLNQKLPIIFNAAKTKTPGGVYFKETLPLLRSMLKQLKANSEEYQSQAHDLRSTRRSREAQIRNNGRRYRGYSWAAVDIPF